LANAKILPEEDCVTFDMQKTLPLPKVPTYIVFYKRQIWLYNLGVVLSKNEKSMCFTWLENEAGRGSQEISSCLSVFIEQHLDHGVKKLELWSDSCGGQNRNIKMVLALKKAMMAHPSLEYIQLNFLVSGHSYLQNERDFAKI